MILADANLLIYAYNTDAPEHIKTRKWFEKSISGTNSFYLSWQTITAFIRISTNPKVFPKPLTYIDATKAVDDWLAQPPVSILLPAENHWIIFKKLIVDNRLSGARVMDAHLATLAIEHNVAFATTDKDFNKFTGLNIINPLMT